MYIYLNGISKQFDLICLKATCLILWWSSLLEMAYVYLFLFSFSCSGSTTGDFHHCQCISSSSFCNKEESLNETCILHTGRQTNTFLMGRVYDLSVHARTDRGDQEVISWMEQHQQHFNTSHYGR